MAKTDDTFIFVATYPDEMTARDDYEVVKGLHDNGLIGSYDSAVVTKDLNGKVHENKDETATRHGAWGGVAAGAAIGLIFPPSILATAAVGGVVGGVGGHLRKGMSRSNVKQLGEFIDPGQAGLVVVGESKVRDTIQKAVTRAEKETAEQLDVEPEGHRPDDAGGDERYVARKHHAPQEHALVDSGRPGIPDGRCLRRCLEFRHPVGLDGHPAVARRAVDPAIRCRRQRVPGVDVVRVVGPPRRRDRIEDRGHQRDVTPSSTMVSRAVVIAAARLA